MSGDNFLARFLNGQRAKGQVSGPLFDMLEGMAGASTEAAASPTTHVVPDIRTVQDFMQERRPAPVLPSSTGETFHAPVERYSLPVPQVLYKLDVCESLTACLDSAECPATARRIFRLLHELALHSIRARGLPVRPSVGVFHLPLELLAAYLGVDRVTVWRNLKPLVLAGLVAERDHYSRLRGQTAVTGKVWAVSIDPSAQLARRAAPVRVSFDDLRHSWRNLDADTEAGRTVWNLTRTEEQKAAYRAKQKAEQDAKAAGAGKGEKEKAAPTRSKAGVQQSINSLKTVGKSELIEWVLAGFTPSSDVTLTVARDFSDGLDAIFTLGSLAALSNHRRNAAVEQTALTLAATFEDTQNKRFWFWLLWQLLRGADQGQNWTEDVAHLLARVLHDIKHDESMSQRQQKKPAALIVQALKDCGLYEALKQLAPTRAGGRPKKLAA